MPVTTSGTTTKITVMGERTPKVPILSRELESLGGLENVLPGVPTIILTHREQLHPPPPWR